MSQTDKQMAGHQRRALRALRVKLLRMAEAWDGVDQFNMSQLIELADQAERVASELVADDAP
jgi:hypothetical protein